MEIDDIFNLCNEDMTIDKYFELLPDDLESKINMFLYNGIDMDYFRYIEIDDKFIIKMMDNYKFIYEKYSIIRPIQGVSVDELIKKSLSFSLLTYHSGQTRTSLA